MEFSKLKLDKRVLDGIKLMGFKETTAIQESCIPLIKAGKDVVGQSLTGSGKTAAFGLPLLEKVMPGQGIQALILTPTRELCQQVRDNLESMGKFVPLNIISIYGGVGFFQQIEEIKTAEIVVATPGRLLDHLSRANISLGTIRHVVLDEADKMFEMGFEEDVSKILAVTPKSRQTIMFSATMPRAAQNIIKKYLKNPEFIKEQLHVDRTLLKQVFYTIHPKEKFSLLAHLLKSKTAGPAIVFCGTKHGTDRVAHDLNKLKIQAMPVHGDLTQSKRALAVKMFKSARIDVLVATDVAARGLDIKDVTHVYNYDIPRTPEEYTHRIGRTARAGKRGDAVSFVTERDFDNFEKILHDGRFDIRQEQVPEFEFVEVPHQRHHTTPHAHQNRHSFHGGFGNSHRHHSHERREGQNGFENHSEYRGPKSRSWGAEGNYSQRRDSHRGNRPFSGRRRPSREDNYSDSPSYGGNNRSFGRQRSGFKRRRY